MPPQSYVTLDTCSGSITLQAPQHDIDAPITAPYDFTCNPSEFSYTLHLNNTEISPLLFNDVNAVSDVSAIDSGMEKLAQTVKRLGISADELAELLTQLGSIEEIEQSEELAEFLKGFSVDDQEVI